MNSTRMVLEQLGYGHQLLSLNAERFPFDFFAGGVDSLYEQGLGPCITISCINLEA